jgi:hypothetical protein
MMRWEVVAWPLHTITIRKRVCSRKQVGGMLGANAAASSGLSNARSISAVTSVRWRPGDWPLTVCLGLPPTS